LKKKTERLNNNISRVIILLEILMRLFFILAYFSFEEKGFCYLGNEQLIIYVKCCKLNHSTFHNDNTQLI